MNTGGLLTTVSHGKPIRLVIFGPDGAFIVTIGDDGSARQWGIRAAG
jgi:WD40 repeat protein